LMSTRKSSQRHYRTWKARYTPEQRRQAWRKARLKYMYGLTLDEYNERLIEQDHACAICRTHVSQLTKPLFVDHDHNTDDIRGLLCFGCNTTLGYIEKVGVGMLDAMREYLGKVRG